MSANTDFIPLNVAILTVSDTRNEATDSSGQYLTASVREAGHNVVERRLLQDDVYLLRAQISLWIADPQIQVVLITGGTGFHERDSTPEALTPLFDKEIDGFGERFRALSADDIGSSTIQSRAIGGLANHTVIFCLPGSTGACRTGWEGLIREQLDSRHRPCNFVALLQRKPQRSLDTLHKRLATDCPLP